MNGDARLEQRTFEMRAEIIEDAENPPRIRGYAALFNQRSEDLGGFVEQIAPGAFNPVMGDDVRSLWNHNALYVLGRTANGTLRIWTDETGLGYEAEPPDTQWARDALVSMRRGDVSQSSFQFYVARDRWEELEDGTVLRTILAFERLLDVSPVTYPAYPQTSASVRSRVDEYARNHEDPGAEGVDAEAPTAEAADAAAQGGVPIALRRRRLELLEK